MDLNRAVFGVHDVFLPLTDNFKFTGDLRTDAYEFLVRNGPVLLNTLSEWLKRHGDLRILLG